MSRCASRWAHSEAGYSTKVVERALLKVLTHKQRDKDPDIVYTSTPYVHGFSHRLCRFFKHPVKLSFSAPNKLKRLTPFTRADGGGRGACTTKHRDPFVDCCVGVVYLIPAKCGKVYIGQTGECVNVRLLQHASTIRKVSDGLPTPQTRIVDHLRECSGCELMLKRVKVIAVAADCSRRLFLEAFYIARYGERCFSCPSVVLPPWI